MTNTFYRTALKASTALVAVAAFAAPTYAQVDDQDNEVAVGPQGQATSAPSAEPIVITGSRIARPQVDSAAPVAVIQDEEFKLSGAVNVEQVINTLPQVIPGTTSFSNNPGSGAVTLNLRGLGAVRTLVLVNGRRYMFFDTNQIVDLNTIPQFLIDSVDVVTGGASAVYGSDAVAGVVNFKLQNDLEGVMAGGQYSITEQGDGARYNTYVAAGGSFDDGRGHATVYADYYNRKPIFQSARGFSESALGDNADGTALIPGGSSTQPQGTIRYFGGINGLGPQTVVDNPDTPEDESQVGIGDFADTNAVVFDSAGDFRARNDGDLYNYAPANYLQLPQERYLLGGYADYEYADGQSVYTEFTFANNRVPTELAATPVTGSFDVNLEAVSPFLGDSELSQLQAIDAAETEAVAAFNAAGADQDPDTPGVQFTPAVDDPGVVNAFLQRRVTEAGSRNSDNERNSFRALVGLRGQVTSNIGYDAYYLYARTRNSNVQAGNVSRSAFQAGLDGTADPINIFGPNTLTPGMVDQISILAQNGDTSELQVANASVNGTFGSLGLGGGDLGLAVGVEYRKVSSEFIPDTALSSGDVIGFNGGLPTAGSYDVKEAFAEVYLPLIANTPGIERLDLTGAVRYSDYSLDAVGSVWTYAGGVEYQPIQDLTLRGQYQRAIRAPNVQELFGGQSNGFPPATDPCSTPAAASDATLRALCVATGVPAAVVGTGFQLNSQIEGTFGGFDGLQEERSESWTAGIILEPRFLPGFTMTVDYFNVSVDDAIGTFGGGLANALNLCYNVIQDANSEFCQVFTEARSNGGVLLGGPDAPEILNANIASLETSGVDLQAAYGMDITDNARLNLSFLGTWTDKSDFTPVSALPNEVNECAGRFGLICGEPTPEYKWTSRASLIVGSVTSSVRWRHLSSVSDDDDSTDYFVEKVGAYDLIDLTMSVEANEALTITAGVNNLFDKEPDLIGLNQEQANTYPGTYDVLGRDFFVAAALRF